jgi:leucyl aminopeptidase
MLKPLALLTAGLLVTCGARASIPDAVWLTLAQPALHQLRRIDPSVESRYSRSVAGQRDAAHQVYVVKVDSDELPELARRIHRHLHHCGGFILYHSPRRARDSLARHTQADFTRPSYKITHPHLVTTLIAKAGSPGIENVILRLSKFRNRYYDSHYGAEASDWLANKWRSLASGHEDVSVKEVGSGRFAQSSVVLTIKGAKKPNEIVVIGAHLDSININGDAPWGERRAPGADDDASGVASETEMLRVLLDNDYRPRRTIKVMAYAAEEVGLVGSNYIAGQFAARGADVVGVLQLDMTNYKGSPDDIYLITDDTDAKQNAFLKQLAARYLPDIKVASTSCGYACSDHVSWSRRGYPASFPFEADFGDDDPYIHSADDTYANSGGQSLDALKFARLALAYTVEIANVARHPESTGDGANHSGGSGSGGGGCSGLGTLVILMLGIVASGKRLPGD